MQSLGPLSEDAKATLNAFEALDGRIQRSYESLEGQVDRHAKFDFEYEEWIKQLNKLDKQYEIAKPGASREEIAQQMEAIEVRTTIY